MVESFETSSALRIRILFTEEETAESSDRISQLPDVLLTHILSLLPTRQSVATGVLSKRWRTLWAQVPVLDFDDSDTKWARSPDDIKASRPTGFAEFVYSVLLLHEARPIKRFRLHCAHPNCSERDMATWMGQVTRRGVENLELSLSLSRYVALPRALFNCDTVSVLRLDGVFLNALANFSVRLPSLKMLCVGDRVLFGWHDFLMKLLVGCPVLEELVLESTYIDACGGSLCAGGNFDLNLNRLVSARIGFSWKESCQKSMFVFFKALNNVRTLSLLPSTVACIKCAADSDIPIFRNLVQLEISFANLTWDLLANLLKHSPKLEVLIISKESQNCVKEQAPRWNYPKYVPECLFSNLRTCCFKEYQGMESELQLVRFIMQHARMLETMDICLASSLDSEAKLHVRRRLSILQIGCESCEISYH